MKKSLFAATAIVILFSCAKEQNPTTDELKSTMPDVLYATVDAQTKAGFNYDSGNKTYSHYWNDGDQIYVFNGTTRRTYSCTNAAGGVFTYVQDSELSTGSHSFTNYCAVFNSTNTTVPGTVGSNIVNNIWQGGSYESSSAPYGYANVMVANSSDEHLEFKNVVGWLKLQLKGWKSVSSIDIVSNDYASYLNGTYTCTFNNDETIDIAWNQDDNTGNSVSFSTPVPLNFSSATDFYLALPACSMNGVTITINYSDSSSKVLSTNNTVTIERNKVTPMAECFVESFTDLSPESTRALTFIVSSGGYYKFKALAPNDSPVYWNTTATTSSASVLWETDNTTTPVSEGSIISVLGHDDQYVYFKTADSFREGNALIQTNNFYYLIWCTDAPAEIALDASTTILDRNIGALSADPADGILSQGLYYQLFRSVPFPGNHAASAAFTTAEPAGNWTLAKGNPTVFYIKSSDSDKSWVSKVNDIITIRNLWFSGKLSTTKEVFDPCPYGYRLITTPSELTAADATGGGGSIVSGTNSSYFPNGIISDNGVYSNSLVTWFNHRYYESLVYVSSVSGTTVSATNIADAFNGYQLRCQKQ